MKEICRTLQIPDITENNVTREEVKDALDIHHLKNLKEEMGDKVKYRDMKNEDLRKPQQFMRELNLEQCAIAMRVKTYMINCAGNMKGRYRGREECGKCRLSPGLQGPGQRETQEHLEVCEGYQQLREGKNLHVFKDKVLYFQEVIKKREIMIKKLRKSS